MNVKEINLKKNTGGIDLTSGNMNVQVKAGSPIKTFGDDKGNGFGDDKGNGFGDDKGNGFGDDSVKGFGDEKGIRFHLDPAMLAQLREASGFVPVIIHVSPVADLRKFLGIV